MKRKHKKRTKTKTKTKKTQGKQYLIKLVTFTEHNRVGCLLSSHTITCGLFVIMLLQTLVPLR